MIDTLGNIGFVLYTIWGITGLFVFAFIIRFALDKRTALEIGLIIIIMVNFITIFIYELI